MRTVFFVIASALTYASNALTVEEMFNAWAAKYEKTYDCVEDRNTAMANYAQNLKLVEGEDTSGKYYLELNGFADLTNRDFNALYTGGPLMEFMALSSQAEDPAPLGENADILSLPTEMDWRDSGAISEVKNQGRCGSCWSFSSTGSLEGAYYNYHGQMELLSEQNLVSCDSSNAGCNGGLMTRAFTYINSHGLASEASFPYTATDGTCHSVDESDKVIHAGEVNYKNIMRGSESAMISALQRGPISVAVDASSPTFQFYSSGVFTGYCSNRLNHAVLLVGYGTSDDGQDYWIVKNSWGATWGDNGYIKLARGEEYNNGDGQCGILAMATQPLYSPQSYIV